MLLIITVLLFSRIGLYLATFHSNIPDGQLHLYFLDVGQGDALLLQTPEGKWGMVDTGRSPDLLSKVQEFMPTTNRELEFVVLTHPDADHIESVLEVLTAYKVKYLFWNKTAKQNGLISELKNLVTSTDTIDMPLKENNDFVVGCCTKFNVLWPSKDFDTYHETESNNISIALLVSYKDFDVFTAGDLPTEFEDKLVRLSDVKQTQVEVLKVGHHGSRTSTSNEFLRLLNPEIGIISVGKGNSYGHPTPEVIQNLANNHVQILRTDLLGNVEISTDGEQQFQVDSGLGVEYISIKH